MKKRTIFTLLLTGAAGLAQAAAPTGHVQSATAVSRVLGDGRKVDVDVYGKVDEGILLAPGFASVSGIFKIKA